MGYVATAIEHIFPLVYEFRKERTNEEEELFRRSKAKNGRSRKRKHAPDSEEEEEEEEEEDEEDEDSSE